MVLESSKNIVKIHYDVKNEVCLVHNISLGKFKSTGDVVVWHCRQCIPIQKMGFIEMDKSTPLGILKKEV